MAFPPASFSPGDRHGPDLSLPLPCRLNTMAITWFERQSLKVKGPANNSIFFFQAIRVPLFYKGRSWPKAIFRGILKFAGVRINYQN